MMNPLLLEKTRILYLKFEMQSIFRFKLLKIISIIFNKYQFLFSQLEDYLLLEPIHLDTMYKDYCLIHSQIYIFKTLLKSIFSNCSKYLSHL